MPLHAGLPQVSSQGAHTSETGKALLRLQPGFVLALTSCGVTSAFQSAPGEVTDFLSFYTLPSTIMNHPTHKSLKAAYSFYNVHTKTPLIDLMGDALILAKSVSDGGLGRQRRAPGSSPGSSPLAWLPCIPWGGLAVGQGSYPGLYEPKSERICRPGAGCGVSLNTLASVELAPRFLQQMILLCVRSA